MPLDQYVEDGHGEGQARLKIGPAPVHDLFEMADQRQHGEDRLDEHAVLPLAALTEFEVGGVALGGMETGITQDNHTPIHLLNQPMNPPRSKLRGITRKGIVCETPRFLTLFPLVLSALRADFSRPLRA